MRELFNLPDVGEGLTEAEIVSWRVEPGDTVAVNDVIVEIETAKAAVELPSPYAGTVHELLAEPGVTLTVGTPIIAIETAAAGAGATDDPSDEGGAKIGEAGKDGRIATLVGYGPRQGAAKRRPRRAPGDTGAPVTPAPAGAAAAAAVGPGEAAEVRADVADEPGAGAVRDGAPGPGPGAAAGPGAGTGPSAGLVPLAPPPVRLLARESGVDLRTVTGSGPHGRITRDDGRFAAAGAAAGAGAPGSGAVPGAAAASPTPGVPGAAAGSGLAGANGTAGVPAAVGAAAGAAVA
ncbi:biotin/lipoyl-containing protein, partial [Pseudonocardia nematodicida]|uniref:biotin/lipoyl-containing protein n=1 Tax=Pseudonocardia nematodicida TaxID=1206997 RepID=UPI003612C6E1